MANPIPGPAYPPVALPAHSEASLTVNEDGEVTLTLTTPDEDGVPQEHPGTQLPIDSVVTVEVTEDGAVLSVTPPA